MLSGVRWGAATCLIALLFGCGEADPLTPVPPRTCIRELTPASYTVFFVVDVSGSMGPFLTDLQNELIAFADNLPAFTEEGRPVTVDFYVVAFVNDVRWYPGNVRRLTDVGQVQRAFELSIADGQTNRNLNEASFNAEPTENLLDALGEVIAHGSTTEATLLMLATDAPFAEAPDELSGGIVVQNTFPQILGGLTAMRVRVHAFVRPESDGLTRSFAGTPGLTSLPGSTYHDIAELTGARDQIRDTLTVIAEGADCY